MKTKTMKLRVAIAIIALCFFYSVEAFIPCPLVVTTRRTRQAASSMARTKTNRQQEKSLNSFQTKATCLHFSAIPSSLPDDENNNQKSRSSDVKHDGPPKSLTTSTESSTKSSTATVPAPVIKSKIPELAGLAVWMTSLTGYILYNTFVGPWPSHETILSIPERVWFELHMIGGMLFGGAILITTALEWCVVNFKPSPSQSKALSSQSVVTIWKFWFDQVPLVNALTVLPGLTMSIVSGIGLAIHNYGILTAAPKHVTATFHVLVTFALWWACTDLTTQHGANRAIGEAAAGLTPSRATAASNNVVPSHSSSAVSDKGYKINDENNKSDQDVMVPEIPLVLKFRQFSNFISCCFVLTLYTIMVMKPF